MNDYQESIFGLPQDLKVCSSCVYTNQKPNSSIEFRFKKTDLKSGLKFYGSECSACSYNKQKDVGIDWELRKKNLQEICDKYRSRNGSYDCLVPGSGGKDSFFAANILKFEYNMNPLTVTWAPHEYTSWGWLNFKTWIDGGFPNYLYHPNGAVHRLLSRVSLENIFHPFQPFMLGQYSFPLRISKLLRIPLIFYGENSAEYGNNINDNDSPTRKLSDISFGNIDEIYIAGESVSELCEKFKLKQLDFEDYLPLRFDDYKDTGIEWHYLGYYMPWHPHMNYYYSMNSGFLPSRERNAGSYSRYTSLDDMMDDFNFFCMYIKYGIGRATFDAAQEIRRGDITREEGAALVKKYDGEFPYRFQNKIFDYLSINQIPNYGDNWSKKFNNPGMDMNSFNMLCDRFRSPHLWEKDSNNKWKLKYEFD